MPTGESDRHEHERRRPAATLEEPCPGQERGSARDETDDDPGLGPDPAATERETQEEGAADDQRDPADPGQQPPGELLLEVLQERGSALGRAGFGTAAGFGTMNPAPAATAAQRPTSGRRRLASR
jgi:hypothetical protein